MVENFMETGYLDPNLNRTHITLIPKTPNPEKLEQFRPISLCNFAYKIISKVLANRLRKWLPDLIEVEQSAFVSGRQIQDNILIVQEVLHQLRIQKRLKKFQAVLKLDMRKAYDRVEWDFLEACLLKMGFNAIWVTWIMQCVRTVSYSVKLNGEPLPYFQPGRGLRQGDPLSPYLFILIANVLSQMMKQAVGDGRLKGIKLNRNCPTLSHLMFADDSIFFLDGKLSECQNLAEVLHQYCMATGQEVNLNKSGIFFSAGCPQNLRRNMALELRVPEITKTGTYLGIPSDWGASKKQMFAWILARVHKKIEGWKENLLSRAGKEILLKTVVQALPQYAMSIFKIPISVCKAIEQKIAGFWWKNSSSRTGIHWKKWDVLKTRKDSGGMGFKDLITFNRAMLGKQAWRLIEKPTTLWAKMFKGLYFPTQEFWQAKKGQRSSWGWQSLIMGRDVIENSVQWSVGNGESIRVWEDKWLKSGKIIGPANREDPRIVTELIDQQNHSWNEDKIQQVFEARTCAEILTIPLPSTGGEDKLVWTEAPSGSYSVKSGYNFLRKSESTKNPDTPSASYQQPRALWCKIWRLRTLPKIKGFIWSICQNALPTKDNLARRRILPDSSCPLCHSSPETLEHLFLLCPWTHKVWSDPQVAVQINKEGLQSMDIWLLQWLENSSNVMTLEGVAEILWLIWKERNRAVFSAKQPDPVGVLANFTATCEMAMKRGTNIIRLPGRNRSSLRWKPPDPPGLKVNIDGAFKEGTGTGAIAGVCRDSNGVLLGGFAREVRAQSALHAETLALIEGLSSAHEWEKNLNQSIRSIETDSLKIVHVMQSEENPPWELAPLFMQGRALISAHPHMELSHCFREQNKVADWVVQAQRNQSLPSYWNRSPPKPLLDLLCYEACMGDYVFEPT